MSHLKCACFAFWLIERRILHLKCTELLENRWLISRGGNDRLPFYLVESTIQCLNKQDLLDYSQSPVFSEDHPDRALSYMDGHLGFR